VAGARAGAGRRGGEAAERGGCVGQGIGLWGWHGAGRSGKGVVEGGGGAAEPSGPCGSVEAAVGWHVCLGSVRPGRWLRMDAPSWGRGLGGEAGPGPCLSSGTVLLSLSPLAPSGSILVSLLPARGRQRLLCPSPSRGVGRSWGARQHPALLPPMTMGSITLSAGDGGSDLRKQGPVPQTLPLSPWA